MHQPAEPPHPYLDGLEPVLGPVLDYMGENNVADLRLKVGGVSRKERKSLDRSQEGEFSCSAEPDGFGLCGFYAVASEGGQTRLMGPTVVPQSLLLPLVSRLDALRITELVIETTSTLPEQAGLVEVASAPAVTLVLERPELTDVDETKVVVPAPTGLHGHFIVVSVGEAEL
jgi:hypothetical protein